MHKHSPPIIKRIEFSNIKKMLSCVRCFNEITLLTKYEMVEINECPWLFVNLQQTELLINEKFIFLYLPCGCTIKEIICSVCFLVLGVIKFGPENCVCSRLFFQNNCSFLNDRIVFFNVIE